MDALEFRISYSRRHQNVYQGEEKGRAARRLTCESADAIGGQSRLLACSFLLTRPLSLTRSLKKEPLIDENIHPGTASLTRPIDTTSYHNHVHETQTLHRLPLRNPHLRSLCHNTLLQLAANRLAKLLPPKQDLRTAILSIRLEAPPLRTYTPRQSHLANPQQSNTETLPRCPTRRVTNPW
jgi:hypothetical protein